MNVIRDHAVPGCASASYRWRNIHAIRKGGTSRNPKRTLPSSSYKKTRGKLGRSRIRTWAGRNLRLSMIHSKRINSTSGSLWNLRLKARDILIIG
jgi:hypothetical protein